MPTAPYELVSGPITLYAADPGTAAPDVDETPSGSWSLLGTNGAKNISEDGLTVTPSETIESQRTLDNTGPTKFFRTEEDLMLALTLLDLTAETFAKVMNNNTVTDVAAASGTPGYRWFAMHKGHDVVEVAILAKGYSPYAAEYAAQYWLPRGYISLSGGIGYQKGQAAGLELEIMAVEDPTDQFGRYIAQDAAAI